MADDLPAWRRAGAFDALLVGRHRAPICWIWFIIQQEAKQYAAGHRWHIFEELQAAPISNAAYVLGEVLAGMTRALLAGGVILIWGALFGVVLPPLDYTR